MRWCMHLYVASMCTRGCQVNSQINVRFEFAKGRRPSTGEGSLSDADSEEMSECLIKVYATMDIQAQAELIADYGSHFWQK